jgi:uncharacterized RDD family membrane protein YckC
MHCKHCGYVNGEDDHRCLRCGRRLSGTVVAAPPGYSGANALAPALMIGNDTMSDETFEFPPVRKGFPAQPTLFTASQNPPNVIPFSRPKEQTAPAPPVAIRTTARPAAPPQPKASVRKNTVSDAQGRLDFLPAAPVTGRRLKTDVEAQVFCEQPVATPTHRFVAAAIDGVFVIFGFALLVTLFEALGGRFGSGKMFWAVLAAVFALVALFYGLIWAIAGRETAGMRMTDLQLITFDGFEVDARTRALRFASAWLSFCSGGLGLLWAVADEENLTWHDHISKTFPTVREVPRAFVQQRRS